MSVVFIPSVAVAHLSGVICGTMPLERVTLRVSLKSGRLGEVSRPKSDPLGEEL